MSKNILMVGERTPRRDLVEATLRHAGFAVLARDGYETRPADDLFAGVPPDLVILCCEQLAHEEHDFIREVLAEARHLIVLCAALPWEGARFLLLANPYKLSDAPPDPESLLEVIEEAFLPMYGTPALRESHRLGSGLGLIHHYVENIRGILKSKEIETSKIDAELDNVLQDVGHVLSMSKGHRKRAAERERTGEARHAETIISVAALFGQARWALPSPPADIRLTFDIEDSPARVKIVLGQVFDILRNLVENSIEAMTEEGGVITVRAFTAHPYVYVEVRDTGPGIAEDDQARVFNMFFSTKQSPGFGLWESRKFARNNGGELTVDSRPGQGATFTLRLPLIAEGAGL